MQDHSPEQVEQDYQKFIEGSPMLQNFEDE